MATLRDSLLPLVNTLRAIPVTFGLRRFAVTVRRRVWSTQVAGEGTATNHDIAITPAPRVRDITARDLTALEAEYQAAGKVVGNMYLISGITPQYYSSTGVALGGYTAESMRLWPGRDTGAIENLVSIVGDDGLLRECEQVTFGQDRAFNYKMLAKEIDRPRSNLQATAITPTSPSIKHGTTVQLVNTGTFNGGATSIVTGLSYWTSSNPSVATTNLHGTITGVAAGTTTITALCLGITSTTVVTVT